MNSTNNSALPMTEIEAASQLQVCLGLGMKLADAVEQIRQATQLARAAWTTSRYAGGEGMPRIDFLPKFGHLACLYINFCGRFEWVAQLAKLGGQLAAM